MSLDNIKNRFELIDKEISNKVFRRKQLMETLDEKQKNFLNLKVLRNNANKSSLYLKSRAYDVRKHSTDVTGKMVTEALKFMYGDDYEFHFAYNEEKLAKGEKSGFNIKPIITSEIDRKKISTSVENASGGGLVEVVSVLLRLAFLKHCNYNGLIVLDETWASVSADEKMVKLIEFINEYIKETNIQVLFITHRAEMFGKNAENIIQVTKKNGIANVAKISYNDILNQRVDI